MIELPAPSDEVVLRWDSLGGLRTAGDPGGAALLVHADGRFSARGAKLDGPRRTGRLTAEQLRSLLVRIVVNEKFASLDGADIAVRIRQAAAARGELWNVMDGGVTRIEVNLPKVRHTVELANLLDARDRFPDIEPLKHLVAVRRLLVEVLQTVQ